MSWLPVPRSPETCQVSWIRTWSAGASISLTSGIPPGSVRVPDSSRTTQPPISQSQCSQPLANGQRPLTRKPPADDTASPRGANTPPTIDLGGE